MEKLKMNLSYFVDNTTSTLNSGTGSTATKPTAFYDKTLLKVLRQRMWYHQKYAQKRPMPKNYGDTVNFRRIQKLEPNLTPLVEGVTPDGSTGEVSAISATTQQYGDYMTFSDVVDFQMVDKIITEYTIEQGHQASETLDLIVRDELNAGSNVFYAGGHSTRVEVTDTDKPTIDDFRKMRLSMKKNHVPDMNGKYHVLVSPETVMDLMDDERFLKAYDIAQNAKPLIDGEMADIYGMKFIEVINAKTFDGEGAGGANVHSSIMLGKEAYGITEIAGEGSVKSIVKGKGSAGTTDPLDQRQSIGWKVNAFVAKRLTEEAIIRYEAVPTTA